MSIAADYARRSSRDADLREAIAAADQAMRETEARERGEIEKRRAARRAQAERAAEQSQAAAAQSQAYDWGAFWQDLEQRIAAAVDARVASYRESAEAMADTVRELMDKFSDTRRELASARDREQSLKERVAKLEERGKQPAPLPVVRQWISHTAALQGEMFAHHGAMWQAKTNTGQAPQEGANWLCVSAPGKDGEPGRGLRIRGLYHSAKTYRELDVVVSNGSSFVAKCDNPGPCPGDGWEVNALVGKRGEEGPRGEAAPKVDVVAIGKAARIASWTMGGDYMAVPKNEGGHIGAPLDLRPYFQKYFDETRETR
jgi:hypothetical protein